MRIMDVDRKMKIYKINFLGIALAFFLSSTLSSKSFATSTKLEKVNGELVVKVTKPQRTSLRKTCASAKYTLKAQSFENKPPTFFVKVRLGTGKNTTTVYLAEVISSKLESSHLIENAKYGCLNDRGGLGIHIPSINDKHADLFLQVSNEGRVFKNFDQTGYTLESSQDDEN